MGFLDGLVNNALGGLLGGNSPQNQQNQQNPQNQPSGISPLIQIALLLLQQSGGLSGIIERFRQAGLGKKVDSWVSTGDNEPVSGHEVTQALGPDMLNQLGSQVGMDPAQLSHGLAQVLPNLINHMTPDGQVPENHHDLISEGLQALLGAGASR
jgi:uncharacterized protein YidB (DUF937 family)